MRLVWPAALMLAALGISACGGGGDDDAAGTATPPAATSTAVAETPEPELDTTIRTIDLAAATPVVAVAAETGGALASTEVLYADLTGDSVEDAVAPISSEGTAGNVAVLVLTPSEGGAALLFDYRPELGAGLAANVVGGQLVLAEPVPGPDDPECCPSQLRTIIYAWDGDRFVVESQTVAPNPQAGSKTPVSP